jgi:hypothetical protein
MTNYKKIKTYLSHGHMAKVKDEDGDYRIYNQLCSDGDIRCSLCREKLEDCYDSLGTDRSSEKLINSLKLTEITPIPHIYKEIKGKVDIIDCPEIKEMANKGEWNDEKIEMIGQKGLETKSYLNNSCGQYYWIYTKNKADWFSIPAQFVVPHLEDDEEDKDREAIEWLEKRGKLKDGKVLT